MASVELYHCPSCNSLFFSMNHFNQHKCNTNSPVQPLILKDNMTTVYREEEPQHGQGAACQSTSNSTYTCTTVSMEENEQNEFQDGFTEYSPPTPLPACIIPRPISTLGPSALGLILESRADTSSDMEKDIKQTWTNCLTKGLISLRGEMDSEFASKKKTHKALWKEISAKLKEIHNFTDDWFQCQSKFNKLTAKYKAVEDANRKSGEKRRSMEFHSEMMEVMGDDPKITPLKTVSLGVGKGVNVVCGEKDDSEKGCEIVKARGEREKKASKRKREDELFELLTEVRDDRRRFQEEQVRMNERKLEIMERLVSLFDR